jgi:hypothetical protein
MSRIYTRLRRLCNEAQTRFCYHSEGDMSCVTSYGRLGSWSKVEWQPPEP